MRHTSLEEFTNYKISDYLFEILVEDYNYSRSNLLTDVIKWFDEEFGLVISLVDDPDNNFVFYVEKRPSIETVNKFGKVPNSICFRKVFYQRYDDCLATEFGISLFLRNTDFTNKYLTI